MTTPGDERSGKRPRIHARHWAAGLSGSIPIGIGLIRDGTGLLEVTISVVIAFVLVFAVGLIAIGPWNDPEHPASVAVLMILLAGVLATVAILLIPESVWPP